MWRMTGYVSRFSFALLLLMPATAQTINFTADINAPTTSTTGNYIRVLVGHADNVGTLGNALLILNRIQQLGPDYESGVGQVGGPLTIAFNRLDQITISNPGNPDPDAETVTLSGRVNHGIGAYEGATSPVGSMKLTLTRTSTSPLRYTLSLTGTATIGGNQVDLAITNAQVEQASTTVQLFDNLGGDGKSAELGDFTVTGTVRPDTNKWDDNVHFLEIGITCTFSPADSLVLFFTVPNVDNPPPNIPVTIVGGTGKYAGATGTAVFNLTGEDSGTATGSVTLAGPMTPIITQVNTASGLNPIGQNTWIEIKGTNLVPPNTPAGGRYWSDAPEFLEGKMPTGLDGVGVTTNGKPAFVWWFCSVATGCASDQINVLTALDDYVGRVAIVVNNGTESSGAFTRFMNPVNPTFLVFNTKGDVTATHADGTLVGPLTLYPGYSTPSQRDETISLWATGFGLPTTPLVPGSSTQSGSLPDPLQCFLNGDPVQTAAALVSPGLYQLNVTISHNATVSDHDHLWCTYGNAVTPDVLLAVQ